MAAARVNNISDVLSMVLCYLAGTHCILSLLRFFFFEKASYKVARERREEKEKRGENPNPAEAYYQGRP